MFLPRRLLIHTQALVIFAAIGVDPSQASAASTRQEAEAPSTQLHRLARVSADRSATGNKIVKIGPAAGLRTDIDQQTDSIAVRLKAMSCVRPTVVFSIDGRTVARRKMANRGWIVARVAAQQGSARTHRTFAIAVAPSTGADRACRPVVGVDWIERSGGVTNTSDTTAGGLTGGPTPITATAEVLPTGPSAAPTSPVTPVAVPTPTPVLPPVSTPTQTPAPSASLPTPTPKPTPTPTPTRTPAPTPTPTPVNVPQSTPPIATPVFTPTPTVQPSPVPTPGWFSPTSFWRSPISVAAPIDAASASYVGTLTHQALDNTWAPWIATDSYSTPVYRVPADQTTVKVTLDIPYAPLQNEWLQVPVPPDARPAAGTDKHMVVYQASTDTMWEFWLMDRATDGWHARWGGRITNFSKSPGYYEGADKWNGATATSLPMVGGLITVDELRNKKIEHALALAIPEASTRAVWPAQRGDGTSNAADAIPSGTRFRIKRSVNVEALPVSEVTKVIARAAQTYGLVVRDTTASSVSLAAEMQSTPGPDIYARPNGLLGSQWQSEIMRSIPWRDMEAIAPPQ